MEMDGRAESEGVACCGRRNSQSKENQKRVSNVAVERRDSFLREKREVYACASRSGALFVGLTSKALGIMQDEGKRNGGIRQSDWYANATFYIHASLYLR